MRFLFEDSGIIHAQCSDCGKILKFPKYDLKNGQGTYFTLEPVECFCGNVSSTITDVPVEAETNRAQVYSQQPFQTTQTVTIQTTGPKCPTCGSTNIKRISLASKAVGGAAFGIFSSNVRKTFTCENCGYKW